MTPRSIGAGLYASRSDEAGAAFTLADLLCLAATPTFAAMAMLSGVGSLPMEGMCLPGPGTALSGMTFMYAIMSAFHSPPWLRWARAHLIPAARALSFGMVRAAGDTPRDG